MSGTVGYQRQVAAEPAAQGRVNPQSFSQGARAGAEAADQLGQVLGALGHAAQQQQQVTALAQARMAWAEQFSATRVAAEQDGNPVGLSQRWVTGAAAAQARIAEGITDPAVRRAFAAEATKEIGQTRLDVLRLEATRTAEQGRATLETLAQTQAQAAALAPNPAARQQAISVFESTLSGMVAGGAIHADQAERQRLAFRGRIDQATVLGLIARDPVQALRTIPTMGGLDPVQQERLMAQAQTALNTRAVNGERAERAAERNQRLTADRVANDLWAKIGSARQGNGQMPTIADIQGQREWLAPGETRALVDAVSNRTQRDDPMLRVELAGLVDRLPPDEFTARVGREVAAGRLTGDTGAGLIGQNRQARRDDGPPSPIAAGRSFVRSSLDPGDVPMAGFMREQLTMRQNNAGADFDAWARQNPNATPEQAEAQSRAIVTRYRDIGAQQLRLTLPKPFGFNGDRGAVTPEALQAAARALLTSGLPAADIVRETANLQSWAATFSAPAPVPGARPATPATGRGAARQPTARTE